MSREPEYLINIPQAKSDAEEMLRTLCLIKHDSHNHGTSHNYNSTLRWVTSGLVRARRQLFTGVTGQSGKADDAHLQLYLRRRCLAEASCSAPEAVCTSISSLELHYLMVSLLSDFGVEHELSVLATGVSSPEAVCPWIREYIGRAVSFMYPYVLVAGPNKHDVCSYRMIEM